jgi:tetratricopeptide (TPR) repeat protein
VRFKTCNPRSAFGVTRRPSILLGVLVAAAAAAQTDDGLRLAAEGRCAEALPLLANPADDVAARRARALCLLQEADYPGAVRALEALEASEPKLAVDLGIALYHTGDRAAAEAALKRAEAAGAERAEVPLYLGLIALDAARAGEATQRFERVAARGAPDPLASVASYYAGVSLAREGRRDAAREAFGRVAREWPGTIWAAEAERELSKLADDRAGFATLRLGFEHDSNAVLRGDGVVLPPEIASEADQRFVWRGAAGHAWSASPALALGAALGFSGSAHGDLARFDVLHPSLTLWADRRFGEDTTLRGVAGYSHAWVGKDSFLSAPAVGLELHHAGERGDTEVFVELAFDDYRFPTPADSPSLRRARDRDGLGVRIGAEHRLPIARLSGAVRAGLAYRRFSADGTEYSFDSPELDLGWDSLLSAQLRFGAGFRYAYRHYRHPTTFETPPRERREHDWRTELSLARPIWGPLSLEARWRYQRNHSTAAVFDYSRHIGGLYLSWTHSP